jgi:hypothetical protein
MPQAEVIAVLITRIKARQHLYASAYASDLRLLSREFGNEVMRQAIAKLNARPDRGGDWDQQGHARAVRRGIHGVLEERRQREEDF